MNAQIDATVTFERMRRVVGRGAASAANSARIKRLYRDERLRPRARRRRRWPTW